MLYQTRRHFIKSGAVGALAFSTADFSIFTKSQMKLGLVTYLWGKDWDVDTIIRNCEKANLQGVELRTEHAHRVEPTLTATQRKEVKAKFANSAVTLVGYGSNAEFDSPDPAVVSKNIDLAKQLLQLSHDVGGSGVKVKPNKFHEGVPHEKTLEQIGGSLNELGKFAKQLNQQLRLEVHGAGTQELPNIKAIMDVADHPSVAVCWNSNPEDLKGEGLVHNFNLVKNRLGDTVHIHEMNNGYPWKDLITLLHEADYKGWLLLECSSDPSDKLKALEEQSGLWRAAVGRQ